MICTDAAGMVSRYTAYSDRNSPGPLITHWQGCNIRNVDVVVQWKLPATFSNFVQRAGQAARGHDCHGLAVLLVEPSVYSVNLSEDAPTQKKQHTTKTAVKKAPKKTPGETTAAKAYAKAHGVGRGGIDKNDMVPMELEVRLDTNAEN